MIELDAVERLLQEANELVGELNGREFDDRKALTEQNKSNARKERARMSQDLNLLAGRLDLAAHLVRNEYWFARGEADPLRPERR